MSATARHRRHANPFTCRGELEPLDVVALFGRDAPLALDVGCGGGLFTCALAGTRPELNVLGLEIRAHLVADVRARARALGLGNLAAAVVNANLQLPAMLPPQSVALVAINFPDPWYKKRHHKRRVVQPAWLQAIAPALRPGAEVHAMSDYLPVATAMDAALRACPGMVPAAGATPFLPRSSTGLTSEREIKHELRGEPIYRLQFVYHASQGSS